MKALTVQQPWAWAIAAGHKPVENRGWTTTHRGPLAIHAGKTWDHAGARIIRHYLEKTGAIEPGAEIGDRLLVRGAVICVVDLTGICSDWFNPFADPCGCGDWAEPEQHHWQLHGAEPLDNPVPARGRLNLWDIDLGQVIT